MKKDWFVWRNSDEMMTLRVTFGAGVTPRATLMESNGCHCFFMAFSTAVHIWFSCSVETSSPK